MFWINVWFDFHGESFHRKKKVYSFFEKENIQVICRKEISFGSHKMIKYAVSLWYP